MSLPSTVITTVSTLDPADIIFIGVRVLTRHGEMFTLEGENKELFFKLSDKEVDQVIHGMTNFIRKTHDKKETNSHAPT